MGHSLGLSLESELGLERGLSMELELGLELKLQLGLELVTAPHWLADIGLCWLVSWLVGSNIDGALEVYVTLVVI